MKLSDLVIIQQTNRDVKNTNNSHYKWLEMSINANITENKVKSMYNTRTIVPPYTVSLLILINIICRQGPKILLFQEDLTKT